jgi:hypothetical protein
LQQSVGLGQLAVTGGGKWVEITVPMDPLYLSVLVSAEKKFWRCVQFGEVPHLINAEPPRPRIEAVRIVCPRRTPGPSLRRSTAGLILLPEGSRSREVFRRDFE